MPEDEVRAILADFFPKLDEDSMHYFVSIIMEGDSFDEDALKETLCPFLESYGLVEAENMDRVCNELCAKLKCLGLLEKEVTSDPKTLEKAATFSKSNISAAERESLDTLWGFDKIRERRNETIEINDSGSAKYERKALKDQKKWLQELESKFVGHVDDNEQISSMTLPDLSGNNREKDIHVNSFSLTFGGQILLEDATLKIVYGRRYGLIGRNGIGKTTLLRHMASFDLEGFPRHHRVLHVKQEVQSSEKSVFEVSPI